MRTSPEWYAATARRRPRTCCTSAPSRGVIPAMWRSTSASRISYPRSSPLKKSHNTHSLRAREMKRREERESSPEKKGSDIFSMMRLKVAQRNVSASASNRIVSSSSCLPSEGAQISVLNTADIEITGEVTNRSEKSDMRTVSAFLRKSGLSLSGDCVPRVSTRTHHVSISPKKTVLHRYIGGSLAMEEEILLKQFYC